MHITMPPSDTDKNIKAIEYAVAKKAAEVQQAQRHLDELKAELRGLNLALDVVQGKPTQRALKEL